MIMLQRASEGEDKDLCEMCLATGIGADKCEAVCGNSDEEETNDNGKVKSGDLEVDATANNGGVILAKGVSDMDTLTFKTSEEVEITKVVLERYGYSKNENVAKVWLEDENGTIISNESTLNSKAQVTLTLKKDYRNVDGTFNATIVIEADAEAGNTIGFKVVDVASTAKNLDLDDYKPYTYSVVEYDGADLILTYRSATKTYNWEAGESYEVAKFKLKAPSDSAITVKSFTLTDAESNAIEYDDYLEDVKVTVAGKEVKSSYSVNKDDELVINLKDVELAAKDNAEFVVSIKLSDGFDNAGKKVHFYVASSSNVSATDAKTDSRVLVKALDTYTQAEAAALNDPKLEGTHKPYAPTFAGNPAKLQGWYDVTFDGGKVKISSKKLGNIEASEESTDIVIAEGEITTSQTIKVVKNTTTEGLYVTVTNNNASNKDVVKAMRIEIDGDEYEGTAVKTNGIITSFSFPAIDIDRSGKIRILVDTVDSDKGNQGDYVTFKLNGLDNFKYEESKTKADIAGSLNISRLTLTASKSSLTNTISSDEVEFKATENSEEVTILKGQYTAKKRDVYLNEFFLGGVNATDWVEGKDKMTVYLYIDGEPVADAVLEKKTAAVTVENTDYLWVATDTFSNILVKAGESVDVELKAQVEGDEYLTTDPSAKKFTLYIRGEDENGNNPSGSANKQTAKISIVNKGTAEIEVGKAKKTVLLRGAEDAIAEFIVKPSGANSMDLESVAFAKANLGTACTNLKLEGAVDEDFVDGYLADGTTAACVADGFVENISKDGETVRIVFDDEPPFQNSLIAIAIESLQINGKDITDKFYKAYADGIITLSQKGEKTSLTTYTIEDIKGYNASTKVSNIRFFTDDACSTELNLVGADDNMSKGDEFTVTNACDAPVLCIKYTVTRGTDVQDVEVKHSLYPDYFKTTGGDKLRAYDNGKDNCSNYSNKKASSISLNKNSTNITAGNNETLTATVTPADAVATVTWTSSDTAVATVDSTGKVTGVAAGTATITASAGSNITATCTVTVS